jgi:ketosteroid isomerase-like protein
VAPEPARLPAVDSLFNLDRSRGDSVARRGPVDGGLAFLAPNVAFLRAGVPFVYGRDSVRALLTATKAGSNMPHWEPLSGGVSYDLRSAYTYGATVRVGAASGEVRFERYIAYWERQRGGPWRITAYAEIDGPAATGAAVARIDPPDAGRELPRPIADAVAKVRATDSLFSDLADRAGIPAAFAENVDEYGAVFGEPALVVGPKAVQQHFAAQGSASSLSWRPVYASVAGSLDLGFTIGEYTATSRGASGAAIQRFGKYLTVWKREADGSWKFMIDGGNLTPAKPE